jgi:hypothetical protein
VLRVLNLEGVSTYYLPGTWVKWGNGYRGGGNEREELNFVTVTEEEGVSGRSGIKSHSITLD